MLEKIKEISNSKRFEYLVLFGVSILIYKIFFPSYFESIITAAFSEFLVFGLVILGINYTSELIKDRFDNPISIVLNKGIFVALIFLILTISSFLLPDNLSNYSKNLIYIIFSTLLFLVFVWVAVYLFSVQKGLFYLGQKRDLSKYFNAMCLFLALTSIMRMLNEYIKENIDEFSGFFSMLPYFEQALAVVTVLLIVINSLRVSWIAFLSKKQKMSLILLSIVLSTVYIIINIMINSYNDGLSEMLLSYSPGFHTFFAFLMLYGAIYYGVIFFTALFHLPTAEAFDRKAEEVTSLVDLSKLLTQVFDFKELAETITTTTIKVSSSEAAWLVTNEDDNFQIKSVINISYVEANEILNIWLETEPGRIEEVKNINSSLLSREIKSDFSNFQTVAVAPLRVHNKTNGFLFVARKNGLNFDKEDRKVIGAYADYAAIALENAILLKKSIEKERLEKELDVAREIQYKILPTQNPLVKNLDISSLFVPAFEVGGDYYDFFELDNDKFGFVIADVSGKSIQAAFIMAEVKGVFESLAKIIDSPRELLSKVNEILVNSLPQQSFVTAIYGTIDLNKGILKFARAGHTPLIHISGDSCFQRVPKGLGLGLDKSKLFYENIQEKELHLKDDDLIVLFTDGITEAKNADNDDFGIEKFQRLLTENKSLESEHLANKIIKNVSLYSTNKSQHDDITLVIFKWRNFKNKNSE